MPEHFFRTTQPIGLGTLDNGKDDQALSLVKIHWGDQIKHELLDCV